MCEGSGRRPADAQTEKIKNKTRFRRKEETKLQQFCALWRAVNTFPISRWEKCRGGLSLTFLPISKPGLQNCLKYSQFLVFHASRRVANLSGHLETQSCGRQTRPLNESAHQSCIIKARRARLEGRGERGGGGGQQSASHLGRRALEVN